MELKQDDSAAPESPQKAKHEFDLPYYIRNCGDGSAAVRFTPTQEEADKADAELEEWWSERCSSSVKIKVEDNKLFFRQLQKIGNHWEYVWVEVKTPGVAS